MHLRPVKTCWLAAALVLGLASGTAQAGIKENVLQPTPLVLKDGRIAYVMVHTIPFEAGEAEVAPENMTALQRLLEPVATDCFLTAQAIGHVKPGAGSDGDTLEAHRLARARADKVQQMLIDDGLPAEAIASVWDWQFLIEEPRVTLWIFRLVEGEDCEGKRIQPGNAPQVATGKTPLPGVQTQDLAAAPQETGFDEAQALETLQATPPASIAATAEAEPVSPTPETGGATASQAPTESTAPTEEAPGKAVQAFSGDEAEAPETDMAARATGPAETAPDEPEPPAVEALSAVEEEEAGAGAAAEADIVFAVNSSYLPSSAGQDLRAFLDRLEPEGTYTLEVAAAVGTGDVANASPEEAKRYNRWMAERRVSRITEWLQKNAQSRRFEVQERYIEGDTSRRVVLQAKPST